MFFNKDRANEYMEQCNLQALIATSPVNITYFSGWNCWLDNSLKEFMLQPGSSSNLALSGYAFIPFKGDPALVVNPLFAANAADLWIRDIRVFGHSGIDEVLTSNQLPNHYERFHNLLLTPNGFSSSLEALLSVLDEHGMNETRIGIEMEGLTLETIEKIRNKLPRAMLMDCSNLIRLIRMVKTDYEIENLTKSAAINEQAGIETLAEAYPGTNLKDLTRSYKYRVAQQNAEFDHFAIGLQGLGIVTEPDYKLEEGEVLFVDFGCIYQSCFSDTGMTLALGELSNPIMARFESLRESVLAGLAAVRPGIQASVVRQKMWEEINKRGFSASYPHGHGIGLEVRDYPIIVSENGLRISDDCIDVSSDLPFEKNMVFNLEASMFLPGIASLQVERSFVVTSNGSQPLVSQDRTQPCFPIKR